jgi:hypothetical protein
VDADAFEGEEAAGFGDDDLDAESGRQGLAQLVGLGDLDQAVAALLAAGQVRALVGDQLGDRIGFLAQLQPSPRDLEVGVALAQRPPILGAELVADPEGPGRVAVARLQLQVSARAPDPATLPAGRAPGRR